MNRNNSNNYKKRIISISIIGCLIFGGFFGILNFTPYINMNAAASTLYVGGTGTGNYTSIQAAIDAANPGDTIRIFDGTYQENFFINTSLNIKGNGSAKTIIKGASIGNIVTINANWVSLSNFKITNGYDMGIRLYSNHHNMSISNVTLTNNDEGIYGDHIQDLTIVDCEIFDNDDEGIRLYDSKRIKISKNYIHNNSYRQILIDYSSDSIISFNTLANGSYGVYTYQGFLNKILNNNILNCNNYGIRMRYFKGSVKHNYLKNNYIGMYFSQCSSKAFVTNQTIIGGSYSVYVRDFSDVTIYNSSLGNGQLYLNDFSDLTLVNTSLNKSGAYFQDDNSKLIVKWYLHVSVNDTEGNPTNAANVIVTNANNKTIANRTTDVNGFTGWIKCTEFKQTSSSKDYSMNDHTITVSKGEAFDNRDVNMTQTKTEFFTLDFNSYPSAIDLKISKSTVLRTNSIYIYSNGTDMEDIEKNLTPNFEYCDPNEQVWNTTYFSSLQYQNSRWEVTFTPSKTAVFGLYDFRVRFNDTIPALSDWLRINDSLSVLNNIPEVENIFISNDSALLGDSIYIWINGTDIEDAEDNLSIKLEYRDPNEISWDTLDLNEPEYLNEKWVSRFNITINALFGYYDFRVRGNDTDCDGCSWCYLNDSLFVYNTGPKVIDIELSESTVFRTNAVFLYINGSDYETPEGLLDISVQFTHASLNEWNDLTVKYSNNTWEVVFPTNTESILGYYDFRVKFEDNESLSSGWEYLNGSLEVLNNPPKISIALDDINVGLDSILFDLSGYEGDKEDHGEDLIWSLDETQSLNFIESISIIDSINDTLKIVPLENVAGEVDIELTLTDKDGSTATKSDITIHVDSLITNLTPKVTLMLPVDTSIINTLTPALTWELDYEGDEIISYTVFLDESPDPTTKKISDIISTSYTIETELEDGKTYYWKVIPRFGVCLSTPFSFTIDLSFEPIYKLNLTSEIDFIVIKQGDTDNLELTIRNEGNTIDNVEITYSSVELQSQIDIDKSEIQLEAGISSIITLNITIPEDFAIGKYSISITATSLIAERIKEDLTISVRVISKDFMPDYNLGIILSHESIDITQGESENVTITITNEGNIVDDYTITLISGDIDKIDISYSEGTIVLEEGKSGNIIITITALEDLEPGQYHLKFLVTSETGSNEINLTVNVKPIDEIIKDDDENDYATVYAIISLIVIIIIVIILFYLFILKKNPPKESELDEKDELSEIQPITEFSPEGEPETFKPSQFEHQESTPEPELDKVKPEVSQEEPFQELVGPPSQEYALQLQSAAQPKLPSPSTELQKPPVPKIKRSPTDYQPIEKTHEPPIPKIKKPDPAQKLSTEDQHPPIPKIKGRIPISQNKVKIMVPRNDE